MALWYLFDRVVIICLCVCVGVFVSVYFSCTSKMTLKDRKRDWVKERKKESEEEGTPTYQLISQMPAKARARSEPGTQTKSPTWMAENQSLELPTLPHRVCLNRKWVRHQSQVLNKDNAGILISRQIPWPGNIGFTLSRKVLTSCFSKEVTVVRHIHM